MHVKQKQFQNAIENEIARDSDGLVIAINGHGMHGLLMDGLEVFKSAFLGYGGESWPISRDDDGNINVQSEPIYKPEIVKQSEEPVSTIGFCTDDYKAVSAVLYSNSHVGDARMEPRPLGLDFILLHNPRAAVPIPKGLISQAANECWVDEGDCRLCCLKAE